MENINLKPSMFNRIINDDDSIILFNSYMGSKHIIKVSKKKKNKILTLLQEKNIVKYDSKDSDLETLIQHGYLINSSLDEKAKRDLLYSAKRNDSTLRLVIHTSENCNFRCRYCYLNFDDSLKRNISLNTQNGILNFIKKNLKNYTALHIDWFGGEPLLAIDAIEYMSQKIIDFCHKLKRPYTAVITTNGYLLTKENIYKLIKSRVKHFAITIDGLKEQHNNQRILKNGKGTFDKIINNLIYIRDNIKTQTLSISLRNNILIDAIDNIENYYNFYDNLFGSDSRFTLFIRTVKDMGGNSVKSIKNKLISNEKTDFGLIYKRLSKIINKLKFESNYVDLNIGGLSCYAKHKNRFTVGVDGSISKCDEISDELAIGKLDIQGNIIIDEAKQIEWLKEQKMEKCQNCYLSCCCLTDPCPKARIINREIFCPIKKSEIDGLIVLYSKSEEIYNIE